MKPETIDNMRRPLSHVAQDCSEAVDRPERETAKLRNMQGTPHIPKVQLLKLGLAAEMRGRGDRFTGTPPLCQSCAKRESALMNKRHLVTLLIPLGGRRQRRLGALSGDPSAVSTTA
jgi:hypothetical protein